MPRDYEGTFTAGPWSSAHTGEGVYGLPLDSGPMAMFYNEEVVTGLGIAVPATWDEYLDSARTIHGADPTEYIADDTGDAGSTLSALWQAGAQPYTVDGTKATIDFSGPEVDKYSELQTTLIKEGLLVPISGWTDEWFPALSEGTVATLITGAWMPGNFTSSVPGAAGKWRVAPQPRWDAETPACAENGGSSLAVMAASSKQALAYSFVQFRSAEDGIPIRVDGGAFPSTTAELDSEDLLGEEFEYFGGQRANEVLAQAAKVVLPGWTPPTLPGLRHLHRQRPGRQGLHEQWRHLHRRRPGLLAEGVRHLRQPAGLHGLVGPRGRVVGASVLPRLRTRT